MEPNGGIAVAAAEHKPIDVCTCVCKVSPFPIEADPAVDTMQDGDDKGEKKKNHGIVSMSVESNPRPILSTPFALTL